MKVVINDAQGVLWQRLTQMHGLQETNLLFKEHLKSPDLNLWVWEGVGSRKKRQAILPTYKMNRPPMAEDVRAGLDMLRELLGYASCMHVCVPGFEADDVIAAIIRATPTDQPIEVRTVDYDLSALRLGRPNVKVTVAGCDKDIPPELLHTYKTWRGDPSDNVKGVVGFGEKAWENCDKPRLADITRRMVSNQTYQEHELLEAGIADKHVRWVKDNWDEFVANWQVTDFMSVASYEIEAGTTVGHRNEAEGYKLINKFHV